MARRLPPLRSPAGERYLLPMTRRVAVLAVAVLGLTAFGTVGLVLSDHYSGWYALRYTLDTLSTIGGLPAPHTLAGQIIGVVLIVLGVGTLFYAFATVTEFFVAGHLGELLAARRMQRMIASLKDHHIICGFGRVGRQVARDLRAAGVQYVVVDGQAENRERAQAVGVRFIEGDAADDTVLIAAGIERARTVLVCADSDAENIFITLTARGLRSDVAIVARAAAEDSERKLLRAGADRVISPYKTSGNEMARLALHPEVSGVLDVDGGYRLEEIVVGPGSSADNHRIDDVRGATVIVGVRRAGVFEPQPSGDALLHPGDVVMALGTQTALARLEGALSASERRAVDGGGL